MRAANNNTNHEGARNMKNIVKLMKHYVQNVETGDKCRVHYSRGEIFVAGVLTECVTIYAKGYLDKLYPVLGDVVENDTDTMTDYFDKDRVRIFADNPLFAAAVSRAA
jgi:hypothetical protein